MLFVEIKVDENFKTISCSLLCLFVLTLTLIVVAHFWIVRCCLHLVLGYSAPLSFFNWKHY